MNSPDSPVENKNKINLPQLRTPQNVNYVDPFHKKLSTQELLKRKTDYSKKIAPVERNVIISRGKSITKKDVDRLKLYFDSIADGSDQLSQKHFVHHF